MFKILNGIDNIAHTEMFELSDHNTRGHSKKLVYPRSSKTIRLNSFCIRTIEPWNALPEEIASAKTVLSFKTLYDRHYNGMKQDLTEIY